MTLNSTQKEYLKLAQRKIIQLRDEVPFIEVGLRINEVLDYLWYVEGND